MYLDLLRKNAARYGLGVLGYCLMPNHVHLIAVPDRLDSLAKGLGRTHNEFARWLQVQEGRTGHLWQNRFYSCPLDEAHCWTALRYIELNPVRGGLTNDALQYPWSSARAHAAGADATDLVQLNPWRDRFEPHQWREALTSSFDDAALADRVREATRLGRPLGGAEFVERLERQLGRVLRRKTPGRRRHRADEVQMKLVIT